MRRAGLRADGPAVEMSRSGTSPFHGRASPAAAGVVVTVVVLFLQAGRPPYSLTGMTSKSPPSTRSIRPVRQQRTRSRTRGEGASR